MTIERNRHPQRTIPARSRTNASARPHPSAGARPRSTREASSKDRVRRERRRQARRQARRTTLLWSAALVAIVGLVTAAMLVTRSSTRSSSAVRTAPGFTLASTSGRAMSLASYRGHNLVLYFSEGVGCDPCFTQMAEFENHAAELAKAHITVVPIVMNPADQVRQEMARFRLHTPYLIDSGGAVSREYHVLGKGMHADLPGHGFVLIDAHGNQRWYGEYPSMYLSTAGLIQQVRAHLSK